jgi:hypothetical protein
MFDVDAAIDRGFDLTALVAQAGGITAAVQVTVYTVAGGYEAHAGRPGDWDLAGTGSFKLKKTPTRIALSAPVRVERGTRLGVYLHTPDCEKGVGFHHGEVKVVRGPGATLRRGAYTKGARAFGKSEQANYFFGGVLEYTLHAAPPPRTAGGGGGGGGNSCYTGHGGRGAAGGGPAAFGLGFTFPHDATDPDTEVVFRHVPAVTFLPLRSYPVPTLFLYPVIVLLLLRC